MDFTFNNYALVLLFFGLVSVFLSLYTYKTGGSSVRWFSLMMLSSAIWSINYGFELASSTLTQMRFFIKLQYLGISTMSMFWLLFCLAFCGKESWYKKNYNFALLVIVPILTLALVWTNNYHHLHYAYSSVDNSGPFPMLNIVPAIWYRIFTIYFYTLLISGCFILFTKFNTTDPIFRKQNYTLIIAAFVPFLANIAYLLGYRLLGHIDATPFAFVVTTFIIFFGIYRFKLLNIIPIARDKVLELMQDGFILLDQNFRIVDYNQAVLRYTQITNPKSLIGCTVVNFFSEANLLMDKLKSKVSGVVEINQIINDETLYIEADIIFLNDNNINKNFTIIKLQNLTDFKKEALRTKEQAIELEKLNQLKDRIFSIIAHDLRGPLVNLSEVLKMTTDELITFEEFKTLSPVLTKDIIYTTELLENILQWSRSQLKGHQINPQFFNLKELVANEVSYHHTNASHKQISIISNIELTEMAYADVLMIQIVVRNLINNAIKFCNTGGKINIKAVLYNENTILLTVQDNGTGINQKIINKLFTDENISTRGTLDEKGTGLGLTVCNDFLKRNNGSIAVESELGIGSTFYIYLPTSP